MTSLMTMLTGWSHEVTNTEAASVWVWRDQRSGVTGQESKCTGLVVGSGVTRVGHKVVTKFAFLCSWAKSSLHVYLGTWGWKNKTKTHLRLWRWVLAGPHHQSRHLRSSDPLEQRSPTQQHNNNTSGLWGDCDLQHVCVLPSSPGLRNDCLVPPSGSHILSQILFSIEVNTIFLPLRSPLAHKRNIPSYLFSLLFLFLLLTSEEKK